MYNIFHQRKDPSIVCVIPDVGVLPTFLRDTGWSYAGRAERVAGAFGDFDNASAHAVIERTGFYVYTAQ
ncbi:hypothetical protein GCM10011390_38640 [Aureimonas endophytica]|uniref:Uncharacterized protein n=1 Tax=Aureimonas endophytica TaxID=2027858 RepID=A0A916ZVC9_9HYPH|nr:hypothetical protein [Aureimonas endophytica]GGE15832.1 hypothetical protein GCM10011390_38640 [Aureimonas endophytica]